LASENCRVPGLSYGVVSVILSSAIRYPGRTPHCERQSGGQMDTWWQHIHASIASCGKNTSRSTVIVPFAIYMQFPISLPLHVSTYHCKSLLALFQDIVTYFPKFNSVTCSWTHPIQG